MLKKPVLYKTEPRQLKGVVRHDFVKSAFTELFYIEHPEISKDKDSSREVRAFIASRKDDVVWVYYPWRNQVVCIPSEEVFYRLRTARNRNLISPDEQHKYKNSVVGIAGLSVGSAVLSTLVATGGPKYIKLADPDILEISNLNRIRATLLDVGHSKTEIAARAAWEVDPFLNLEVWSDGIKSDTIQEFVKGKNAVRVFVDEMDNIQMKFAARMVCKKLRIPVVMATDNGDSIILDVERFDLEPKRPLFHGRVTFSLKDMQNMSREKFVAMANEIIDPTYFTQRQQESIMEIGRSLSGVAQLGTAAALAGVAAAYAVRRIVTDENMPSGRYVMGCEPAFIPQYDSARERKRREVSTKKFRDAFA